MVSCQSSRVSRSHYKMGDSDSPPIKKKKVGRPPSKPHVAGPGRGHDRERIADQSIANALTVS